MFTPTVGTRRESVSNSLFLSKFSIKVFPDPLPPTQITIGAAEAGGSTFTVISVTFKN